MDAGVYLYCIGHSEQLTDDRISAMNVAPADGSHAELRAVRHDGLAAIVSDTEVTRFEIEREPLIAHHNALEAALRLGDILPVSYGTVAASDEEIIEHLLTGTRDELVSNLEYVHGCIELSLRVMWKQERLFQEIVESVEEIRQLRDAVAGVPEEQSYYERVRLGELTSHTVAQISDDERALMLERLTPLCVDARLNSGTSDMLILNASFLVERELESAFDEAVQAIGREQIDRMTFRYLGPLPPASFVSVTIPGSG